MFIHFLKTKMPTCFLQVLDRHLFLTMKNKPRWLCYTNPLVEIFSWSQGGHLNPSPGPRGRRRPAQPPEGMFFVGKIHVSLLSFQQKRINMIEKVIENHFPVSETLWWDLNKNIFKTEPPRALQIVLGIFSTSDFLILTKKMKSSENSTQNLWFLS